MPTMPTDPELAAVNAGLDAASAIENGLDEVEGKAYAEEKAAVKSWLARIEEARNFDEAIYKQMALDRAYAAGFSSHEVSVNLIGSNIDTMKSFLYAKDPDVSVVPAQQVQLPRLERPVPPPDPMAVIAQHMPDVAQMIAADPGAKAAIMTDPDVQKLAAPLLARHQQLTMVYQAEQQAYQAENARRKQLRESRKAFSETMEILIGKTWQTGELQPQGKLVVGSGLTTACGFLKAAWREDRGLDAVTAQRMASLQDNLSRIARTKEQLAERYTGDLDALEQSLTEQIAGMNAQTEVVTSRGMTFDPVAGEDMTFPIGATRIQRIVDMPWIDHRIFMTLDDAKVAFPDLDCEKLKQATTYSQRKPIAPVAGATLLPSEAYASQAGQFTMGSDGKVNTMSIDGQGNFICVHETWDRDANIIRTMIEGVECYAKTPHAPEIAVSRFYPFFTFSPVEVDGQRYPQSLVFRSYKLQDEFNARVTALKMQRTRNKQGIIGDATALDKDEANKVKHSVEGETTYVHTTGGKPLNNVFMAKPTVKLDPALYETLTIRQNIEEIWGTQQALQAGIGPEKTATQSEIEEKGFGARTGYMRDDLERMFNELAKYTAQILIQRLTPDDAKAIAGEGAVWPTNVKAEDLDSLVTVSIRAGTSGKPNTSAERQAWATTMPLLQTLIMQIGQLRGADQFEVADKLEQIAAITLQLSGSSLDIEALIPQEGSAPMQPEMGGAPAPGAAPTPAQDPAVPGPATIQ